MSGRSLRPRREAVYTDPDPDLDAEPSEPRREGLRARSQRVEYAGPSTSRPPQRSRYAAAGGAGGGGGRTVPQRGGQRSAARGGIARSGAKSRSPLGAPTVDIMRLQALESLEEPPDTPPHSPLRSAEEAGPSGIVVRLRHSPGGKAVGWAELPEEMLERVLRVLLAGTSHQRTQTRRRISGALRSVCVAWRRIHDLLLCSLYVLPPTPDAGVRALARRFANVTALDFKGEFVHQPQVCEAQVGSALLLSVDKSRGESGAAEHTAALQNLSASRREKALTWFGQSRGPGEQTLVSSSFAWFVRSLGCHFAESSVSRSYPIPTTVGCVTLPLSFTSLPLALQVTDVGLRAVSQSLPLLTSLNLTYCVNVTDEGMRAVAELSALVTLNLMQCFKITDEGLRNIRALPSLTTLSVRLCRKVTAAGMDQISQLPSLTSLNLSHCSNVTDDGLRALTDVLGLNFLDLRHCPKFTEEGVQWMRRVDPSLKLEHHLY